MAFFYHVFAMRGERYSADVLSDFLWFASGVVCTSALFISMRLVAEERQEGTLPLLLTSPLSDGQLIFAKYLSGLAFLALILLLSLYMPLLIFVNGKISIGHIFAGYVGLLAIGGAVLAIGTFASSLSSSQLVAVVVGTAITVFLILLWYLARKVDGPLKDMVAYLALHDKHFRPFMDGTISISALIFYASVSGFFLTLARNNLESKRW